MAPGQPKQHQRAGYASTFKGTRTSTAGGLKKADIDRVVDKSGSVRYVGKAKRAVAKQNFKCNPFMQAAKSLGFMVKGEAFKPLPKKGTKAYYAIVAQAALMR